MALSESLFQGRGDDPCLMGIVNVTPDSFSDGGKFFDAGAAVARALTLVEAGAQVVDLGAEASSFFRTGVVAVSAEEQLRRLLPVLRGLETLPGDVKVSVDTRSAAVARAAMDAGADVINDVSAGMFDGEMLGMVAKGRAGLILMHISMGYPATPMTDEMDIVGDVREFLHRRVMAAREAGVRGDRIAIDPGIGFGKTMMDNWRLLTGWAKINGGGEKLPVVLGASRKRFLETAPPPETAGEWTETMAKMEAVAGSPGDLHARDLASGAVAALAQRRGAGARLIHRVHQVTVARRALTMI